MVEEMEIPGRRSVGKPERTVQLDMELLGIEEELAVD